MSRLRAIPARVLGVAALGLALGAPWLGERSAAGCLADCAERARASVAASALDVFSADDTKRAAAVLAVLDREAALVFALVVAAAIAVILAPRSRWPRSGAVAAFVGACSVEAVLVAWALPVRTLGLDDTGRLVVVGAVFAVPLGALGACVAPAFRERFVPASWPFHLIAAATLGGWGGEQARWGACLTAFPLALALVLEGERPSLRRGALLAVGGVLPLVLIAGLRAFERRLAAEDYSTLVGFEGRDLSNVGQGERAVLERVCTDLNDDPPSRKSIRLLPDGSFGSSGALPLAWLYMEPWRVLRVRLEGREVCVMVDGGRAPVRISVIERDGSVSLCLDFETGSGVEATDASISPVTSFGLPILDLTTHDVGSGRSVLHEYFAVSLERPILLRIEDRWGKAVTNSYDNRLGVGPPPPRRSPQEWEAELGSEDPVRELEALEWIGGDHENEVEDVFWLLRQSPIVRARVQALCASKEAWVREAALLALGTLPD